MWKFPALPFDAPMLMAKTVVDDFACAAHRLFTRPLLEEQWRRVIGEVDDALAFFEINGWLDKPLLYYDEPPPMRRTKTLRARCRGLDFQQLSFESGYEPHAGEVGHGRWMGYAPNRTAHAWVVRHRGRPRPWLICVPGYGMGTPYIDMATFSVPWLFSRLGLNVMVPVLPFHGPRRMQWASGGGFFSGDCVDTVHAEAQALSELRQLVGWIREHDAPAIGVYGLSLGGYTTALLAAFEKDLDCVVAGIPATDFASLARLHTPTRIMKTGTGLGFDWDKVERLFSVISPLVLRPLVPKSRRFIFGGINDRIVPEAQVKNLWKHWERPQTLWYRGSHLSFYWERELHDWLRPILRASLCAKSEANLPLCAGDPAREAA